MLLLSFITQDYLLNLEVIYVHIHTLCIWTFIYAYTHGYLYLHIQINRSKCLLVYVHVYIYLHITFVYGGVCVLYMNKYRLCVCEWVVKCLQIQENFTYPPCSLDLIYHIIRITKDLKKLLHLCACPKLFPGSIFQILQMKTY